MKFGRRIGLRTKGIKARKVEGIAQQTTEVYYCPVHIRIAGHPYHTHVGFGEEIKEILLGGVGFFDHWTVKFNYPKSVSLNRLQG